MFVVHDITMLISVKTAFLFLQAKWMPFEVELMLD